MRSAARTCRVPAAAPPQPRRPLRPRGVRRVHRGHRPHLGTARFLVIQTVVVVVWIVLNIVVIALRCDPYPFILLNLAFSTQAAYAAPLILLAQNRQELRDRAQTETDRRVAERTQADTEFLAREIASVRLALGDVVTTEDLDDRLQRLGDSIEKLSQQLGDASDGACAGTDAGAARRATESTSRRVAPAKSSGIVHGLRWSPATSTTSAWMALASARCFRGRTRRSPS